MTQNYAIRHINIAAHNLKVVGSNPSPATSCLISVFLKFSGCVSYLFDFLALGQCELICRLYWQ